MTYTLPEIAALFRVKTETIRRRWRKERYPDFFVEVVHGGGKGKRTTYDAQKIDELKQLLDKLKGNDNG